jgi:hypothetical protein
MSELILLTFGLPFGRWAQVAAACLSTSTGPQLLDPAVTRWHDGALKLPPLKEATAEGLAGAKADAPLLAQLAAERPHGVAWWGGSDARLCWTAGSVCRQAANARFLVMVERPSSVLANWLARASDSDEPGRVLKLVSAAAVGMSQLVQRHPDRCLVVDVDEASSHPAAFLSLLAQWTGASLSASASLAAAAPWGALEAVLGERLAASPTGLDKIYERLFASCRPLAEASNAPAATATDVLAAVAQFRDLASGNDPRGSPSQVTDRLRERERENELLLVQLHQVQEELEHYYLAWQQTSQPQSAPGLATASRADLRVRHVDVGSASDTAPHRQLSVTFHGVELRDRTLARVDLRLVEHLGRPGIALLDSRDMPTPLMAWDPSGHEGERGFLLLVPADDPSRQRLARLGTADWRCVEGIASTLAVYLVEQAKLRPALVRWGNVARRLVCQLSDLPPRFRFDRVDVEPVADVNGAWRVAFGGVSFDAVAVDRLHLLWRPQPNSGGHASIELLVPDDGAAPPLASWPEGDDGRWLPRWRLPLAGASRAELAQEWRALTRTDRTFLLGLVDAMPAALPAAVAHGLVSNGGIEVIRAASARALRVAQQFAHGSRLKRASNALRGRPTA